MVYVCLIQNILGIPVLVAALGSPRHGSVTAKELQSTLEPVLALYDELVTVVDLIL